MVDKRPSNTYSYGQFDTDTYISIDTVEYEIHGLRLNLPTNYVTVGKRSKDPIRERSTIHRVLGAGKSIAKVQTAQFSLNKSFMTRVSLSVGKFLSGQNIWSPDRMRPLVGEAHARVLEDVRKFADEPARCNVREYGPSSIRLTSVHLGVCFGFKKQDTPARLMAHVYQMVGSDPRCALRRFGNRYLKIGGQARKGRHIAFYDKTHEITTKMGLDAVRDLGLPKSVLRVELRLERDELKKAGLDRLKAWKSPQMVRNTFERYLAGLMNRVSLTVPALPVSRQKLSKLPPQLRAIVLLKASGVEWELVLSKSTRHRYRNALAKLGILACSAAKTETLAIKKILVPARAITGADLPERYLEGFNTRTLARDSEHRREQD